jgi:hypothetical protein
MPWHVFVTGNNAYISAPFDYHYNQKGSDDAGDRFITYRDPPERGEWLAHNGLGAHKTPRRLGHSALQAAMRGVGAGQLATCGDVYA